MEQENGKEKIQVYDFSGKQFLEPIEKISNNDGSTTNRVLNIHESIKVLTDALLQEVPLDDKGPVSQKDKKFFIDIPDRSAFRTEEGMALPKQEARGSLLSAKDTSVFDTRFFCISCQEYLESSNIDIDHSYPYSQIKVNQENLLNFLCSVGQPFLEGFLSQPAMKNYFDISDEGKLGVKGYFIKQCYNVSDNLILMCHGCNIKKNDKTTEEWVKEKPVTAFWSKFLVELKNKGEIGGILINKIYFDSPKKYIFETSGKKITFQHGGGSQGLGEFMRDWFLENFNESLSAQKFFHENIHHQFNTDIEKIRELLSNDNDIKIRSAERRQKRVENVLDVMKEVYNELFSKPSRRSSDGSSGDASLEEVQARRVEREIINVFSVTDVFEKVKALFPKDQQEGLGHFCDSLDKKDKKTTEEWGQIYSILEKLVKENTKNSPKNLVQEAWDWYNREGSKDALIRAQAQEIQRLEESRAAINFERDKKRQKKSRIKVMNRTIKA